MSEPVFPPSPERQEELIRQATDALTALGLPFELMRHPLVNTIEEMETLGLWSDGEVIKNLFLRDATGKRHFLVLLPHDKPGDLKALRAVLGSSRLSFGSAERLMDRLGLTPGSVSALGLLNDPDATVEVLADRALLGASRLALHPLINTATVWLSPADFEAFLKAQPHEVRWAEL